MSDLTRFAIMATVLQLVVLVRILVKTNKLMVRVKSAFLPFFFILSMASCFLSDVYWVAYDLLKPDTRMPIAANEIGECAMILLLSAGLESLLTDKRKVAGEILYAFLYIGANIALWIVWSGEWLQDILFGIPYIYLLWILIRGLRSRNILSERELLSTMALSVFILAMHVVIRFVDGFVHMLIVSVCYMAMFSMMVWLGVKSFRCKDFFVASTFFLWTNLVMFATPDPYYNVSFFGNTVALLMMFVSMKKEIVANDLC